MTNNNNNGVSLREVLWIILLVLSTLGNIYFLTKKDDSKTFDEEKYKQKIDSLNLISENIKLKNDSLHNDNLSRIKEISKLNGELKELNKSWKYYEQLYKKTIRSIDSMSDNDITRLFTEKFK